MYHLFWCGLNIKTFPSDNLGRKRGLGRGLGLLMHSVHLSLDTVRHCSLVTNGGAVLFPHKILCLFFMY